MSKDLPPTGVFRDAHRHTCILVETSRTGTVEYVPFSVTELRVERSSLARFLNDWEPVPDYAPQRAAERYLDRSDGTSIPTTPEALAHLRRLAGPAFVRESLRDDPTINPASVLNPTVQKEATMSKKSTAPAAEAAPAKRPAAKKTEGATPATKSAKNAKAAPTKAAAKAAKAAPAAEAGTRGRQPNISGSAKIKVLSADNPKRGTAAERFALYKNGMTVDEYIAAGGKRADVNWDVGQGFIEVK